MSVPRTVAEVLSLTQRLDAATRTGSLKALREVLPADELSRIWEAAAELLAAEPTLLEVSPPAGATVSVVGDSHGQFHDIVHPLFQAAGHPSESSIFVFNGDFVDRGAWGTELLAVLAAWKLALPRSVLLLRGNHESTTCTKMYGFHAELQAKYGSKPSAALFRVCKKMFAALPLAAVIGGNTLIVHGGLWRKPPGAGSARGRKRRKGAKPVRLVDGQPALELGSLDDIRSATKGGMDPSGLGASRVAADVLWSDPVMEEGISLNDSRGVGIKFGPDASQAFLAANGLRLIIRSHEGPDARDAEWRPDFMPPMLAGYTLDHETDCGNVMTVFSAPDYPQFQTSDERYNNLGAVLRLREPDYASPEPLQFAAQLPRPPASCFYDLGLPESDEELDEELAATFAGSEASGLSGVQPGVSDVSAASDAADAGIVSSPHEDGDGAAAGVGKAGSKRQRQHDDTAAAESPSEGSTGAAEQKLAGSMGGAISTHGVKDPVQPPEAASEDQCMSTPEAPAVAHPAASVASDARDSFAGNALAAVAAADIATAESQLTPVPSQADASQCQPPEPGSLPDPIDAAEAGQHTEPGLLVSAELEVEEPVMGDSVPLLLSSAHGAGNASSADAVQVPSESAGRAGPALRKSRGPFIGGAPLPPHRKPWK